MHQKIVAAVFGALILSSSAARDAPAPTVVRPESLQWFAPPGNPAVRGAWVIGAQDSKALYALRVRIAAGGRIAPHTHPDTRYTTVLRGTVRVGFGWTADDEALVAMPPGTVYVVPAGSPHYLWARDGEVEYQESGFGPSGTSFEPPPEPNAKGRSWRTP